MPKWIGNYVGIARTFASYINSGEAESGVYNMFDQYYAARLEGWKIEGQGLTATGGNVVGEYVDGSDIYRTHIFTSSGIFSVSELGNLGGEIDYLIVGGGGAGQSYPVNNAGYETGGGGAGAFIRQGISSPKTVSTSPGSYTVVVGGGGVGAVGRPSPNLKGSNSTFYGLTAEGGGGGGDGSNPSAPPAAGGSGGGGSYAPPASPGPGPTRLGGPASGSPAPSPVVADGDATDSPNAGWGHPGGNGTYNPNTGAGGGGAGGGGGPGPTGADGGRGLRSSIAGGYPGAGTLGGPGPGPVTHGWFAGGGGGVGEGGGWNSATGNGLGGTYPETTGGPYAGAGSVNNANPGYTSDNFAAANTGSGGGAGRGGGTVRGGNGGSGIVVVRYKIGSVQSPGSSPKGATGGSITQYKPLFLSDL